jgi:DNA-binding beta-propeller fold protein YncE
MKAFSALLVLFVSVVTAAISAAGPYRLLRTIHVGGAGVVGVSGTVDPVGRRLYVTHNTQIEVVDVDSGKLVGKVDNTPGVRAIAVAPDLGRGFAANGQASTTTFDLKTLATLREVKGTGAVPAQIAYDRATARVFTLNRRGYNLTAIDAQDGTVAGTIELDSRPEFAVSDGNGRLLVSLWEKEVIVSIDSRTMTAAAEPWSPKPCQRPTSMAIDQKNGRLFVGCSNRMMVVLNTRNGRLITRVPTSQGRGVAVAFDPELGLVFSSNGEGTNSDGVVTVIRQESPDKYRVVETLKIGSGARAIALDEKTHRVFVPIADQSTEMGVGGNDIRYVPDTFRVLVFGM